MRLTSLLHGEEGKEFCQCGDTATKIVIYYRFYDGLMKRFQEMICEDCLNDADYFRGKTIVSIEMVDPESSLIFTQGEVYEKFNELFNIK